MFCRLNKKLMLIFQKITQKIIQSIKVILLMIPNGEGWNHITIKNYLHY